MVMFPFQGLYSQNVHTLAQSMRPIRSDVVKLSNSLGVEYCLEVLMYISPCNYRPQRSCGKASVILFTGGVSQHAQGQTPPWADTPPGRQPLLAGHSPLWVDTPRQNTP